MYAYTGNYICRITNPFINDPYKATVFTNYAVVTIVRKRGMPNFEQLILEGTGYRFLISCSEDYNLPSSPLLCGC